MLTIEVEYSKTYSMIYDILGLGRLIHNDREFLELYTKNSIHSEKDIVYYESLINMVGIPNEDVSCIFTQYKDSAVARVIFENIQESDKLINIEDITDFYDILSDIDFISSAIDQVYFPELTSSNNVLNKSELYNKFLVMPISKKVENSLYLFFENQNDFCKLLVDELKKYCKVINKIYTINNSEIIDFKSAFKNDKIEKYNIHYNGDLKEFKKIIIGIVYTNIDIVYYNTKTKKDTMILYLGKNSDNCVMREYHPRIDIVKLRQVISDETRIKILYILKEQDMYLNEIGKRLGLKNNTIMYHIDVLVKENLLNFYMKEKNIYYKINKQFFEDIYQFAKEFI